MGKKFLQDIAVLGNFETFSRSGLCKGNKLLKWEELVTQSASHLQLLPVYRPTGDNACACNLFMKVHHI